MKDLYKLQEKIDTGEEIHQSEQVDVMFQLNEKLNICHRRIERNEKIINVLKYLLVIIYITCLILVFK